MIQGVRTFGRVLAGHWPTLLMWFLASTLVHDAWLDIAGYLGGTSAIAGILLVPIAVGVQLVSYVAMFLVIRDALRSLRALAPSPPSARERRREFAQAILAAMLPYIAFYTAQGYMRSDLERYAGAAWGESFNQQMQLLGDSVANMFTPGYDAADYAYDASGRIMDIGISPLTVSIVVAAYALRTVWKRFGDRVPRWLTPVALYLEVLWMWLAVGMVDDVISTSVAWIDARQGVVWLAAVGAWFATHLAPVAWLWNTVTALLGQVFAIMAAPLAWLAIAGTIYGRALPVAKVDLLGRSRRVSQARTRYAGVDASIRRRVDDLTATFTGKFTPLWNALTMMFRAGPMLIGAYVLAYALWALGSQWLRIGAFHAFGPHDVTFWMIAAPLITVAAAAVTEITRIALSASAFDSVLGILDHGGLDRDLKVGPTQVAESDDVRTV